jgi:hypothetical protein
MHVAVISGDGRLGGQHSRMMFDYFSMRRATGAAQKNGGLASADAVSPRPPAPDRLENQDAGDGRESRPGTCVGT